MASKRKSFLQNLTRNIFRKSYMINFNWSEYPTVVSEGKQANSTCKNDTTEDEPLSHKTKKAHYGIRQIWLQIRTPPP